MLKIVAYLAFPIVCVIAGTVAAVYQVEGWGWLFFLAFLSYAIPPLK